jgi:TolA-binding protein
MFPLLHWHRLTYGLLALIATLTAIAHVSQGARAADPPAAAKASKVRDAGGTTESAAADDSAHLRSYLAANGLLNRGLYELAIPEYRAFLEAYPGHARSPQARYGLGVCLFRIGRADEAAETLKPLVALRDFEFAGPTRILLAQIEMARASPAGALEHLDALLRDHPADDLADDAAAMRVEALYLADRKADCAATAAEFEQRWPDSPLSERVLYFDAAARLEQRDAAGAVGALRRLLERFPSGGVAPQAHLLLAHALEAQGERPAAAAAFERALAGGDADVAPHALLGIGRLALADGDAKAARAALTRIGREFASSPQRIVARYYLARCDFEQRRYDVARSAFDELALELPAELRDDAAYWSGKCSLRQAEFAAAVEAFERLLREHADSELRPEALYDLSVAHLRAGREEEAMAAAGRLVREFPAHALAADAIALQAQVAHQRGDYEGSSAHCDAFLQQHVAHAAAANVAFLRCENDFLLERFEAAADGYRRFVERYPAAELALQARYRAGLALARLNRLDEAAPYLSEVAGDSAAPPEFRDALLVLADAQLQRENLAGARKLIERYLAGKPEGPAAAVAWLKLGVVLARQADHAAAAKAFDRALAGSPTDEVRIHALFERGQARLALKRDADAARDFETVLEAQPQGRFAGYALRRLVHLARAAGDQERALALLDRLGALAGDDTELATDALAQRGALLLSQREFAGAEAALRAYLEQTPEPAPAAAARAQLFTALSRQNRYAEALQEVARLEAGGLSLLSAAERDAVRYEKAWCLRAGGRAAEAAAAYRELLSSAAPGPLSAHATVELAELDAAAGRCDAAVAALQALRSSPAFAELPADVRCGALYRLGICAREQGEHGPAVEALSALLTEFPDHALAASAAYFAGESSLALGRPDRAAPRFERAARADDRELAAAALLKLGEAQAAQQHWPASEKTYTDFLARFADDPRWPQARFGVGWARENQGRPKEAVEAYADVVARHAGELAARAQFQIGECLFAQKQYEPAVRELLKVEILFAYPQWSAAALFEAARCFEAQQDADNARKHYAQVAERYADSKWAAPARDRLTALKPAAVPGR